jgi:hypothetical protein
MCYAKTAAEMLTLHAVACFGEATMGSTWAGSRAMDAFDHKGYSSSKYLPEDKLNADLGQPEGAGVFGSYLMGDGSRLLRTCNGRLAYWDGTDTGAAHWGTPPTAGKVDVNLDLFLPELESSLLA